MASVVVTGTSAGIGLATAVELGRAGHTVYATMRNLERGKKLAGIVAAEGLPVHLSEMDVDSDASVEAGFRAIEQRAGTVDVLVNNAGIERSGATEDLAMADIVAVMETNYFGPVRCAKQVLRGMRLKRSGLIVNVASIAGHISTSPLGAYAASKQALEAISESLAQEMKMFGVRVAVVEPGIIDTAMARGIETAGGESVYPHQRRFAQMFAAALKNPVPPELVAQKIRWIIESGTWTLRHPVGPDAEGTMAWRRAMTDEEYIDLNSADDATWERQVMAQRTRE